MNGLSRPRVAVGRRASVIAHVTTVFAVSFAACLATVRDWTDVKIAVACATVACVARRSERSAVSTGAAAVGGILLGHVLLGAFVAADDWPVVAWVLVGSVAALEVLGLIRILTWMTSDAETRLPSRRILSFVGGAGALAIVGAVVERAVIGATNVASTSSSLDTMFGIGIAACLAAVAVTRRGTDWFTSARPPGSELLAPLMVVLVTLVAVQVTRQVWAQRDEDRLEVLARSVHATLNAQWERETDVLRTTAQALTPALAFDDSQFARLVRPYLVDSDVAVAAALGRSTGSVIPIDSVDDGTLSVRVPDSVWAMDDALVDSDVLGDNEMVPLVVVRTNLLSLPEGGELVLSVAFSVPEWVASATADVIGRFDDIGVVVLTEDGASVREAWVQEGIGDARVRAGDMSLGGQAVSIAVSPTSGFAMSAATKAGVVGFEFVVGLLLGGVLVLGANAEFKMTQERRRRENLLEAALDATPGSSVVFDANFRILAANRPVRQRFATDLPGLEVFRLFGLEENSGRRRMVEDLLRSALNGQAANIEIAEDSADGSDGVPSLNRMRIIELSAYPVTSPGGEPVGFLHSVDATERRSLAMRSAQSERMESLGALAGGLAHDFNNLLFVTLGNLQLMAMNEAVVRDEKLSKFVSRSMSAVERGAEITKSLLAVARSQPLEESAVSLGDLVKGILPLVRQALGAGRRVEVDIPDPGLQLMLDSGRLSSCILNLAFNARDAMGPNGTLRIGARLDEASDSVELSVADDGAGMPAEVVARAFEPFFTTKSPGSGTGLGLATVYAFAKQSGGTAYLESRPGSGTTVTMVLPRFSGEPVRAGAVSTRRSGRRVVVADDEQDLAEMVAAWLIDMGIDARFATSPKSALELIESFEPDVLVSDANFGEELDGIELARLGTAIVPDMAVVFMTGYSTSMRELQELGERTLAKPFSREDLYSALTPLIAEDTSEDVEVVAPTSRSRRKGRSS